MTPEDRALAAAFLAECWRTVPEYHPSEAERVYAQARADACQQPVDKPRRAA